MKWTDQLFKKSTMAFILLLFTITLEAQTLSGIIKNTDHKPIAGVSIKVSGSNTNVTSNKYGKFELPANNQILMIELVMEGFNSETILLKKGQQKIQVLLLPDLTNAMDIKINKKKNRKHPLLAGL